MKRDMDLTRAILQKIESWDEPRHLENLFPIDGYSENQIAYHVNLLFKDRVIDALSTEVFGVPYRQFSNIELTPRGHDAIDTMKDDTKWNKFKAFLAKTGKAFTIDLLLSWAKGLIE